MKKKEKEYGKMKQTVRLALSRFTAELLGRPNDYKSHQGGANFYPSDCLYDWGYRHIDKDGRVIERPELAPLSVAGITCGGRVHMKDTPRVLTIWFKDI